MLGDHTFKTASKIKVFINGENTQPFSCLYDIHSRKQVLLVRFVSSSAFENIADLHEAIERKNEVTILCVDNCCQNEKEIQDIHPNADIKLFIFFFFF